MKRYVYEVRRAADAITSAAILSRWGTLKQAKAEVRSLAATYKDQDYHIFEVAKVYSTKGSPRSVMHFSLSD